MSTHVWMINGHTYDNAVPLSAPLGRTSRRRIQNMSMMSHRYVASGRAFSMTDRGESGTLAVRRRVTDGVAWRARMSSLRLSRIGLTVTVRTDRGVTGSGRHQVQRREEELDEVAGQDRRQIERAGEEPGHPPAVVLRVDHDDRDDDQVGEDERNDTAEADAAVPQHRGEWDVADRADERCDRDERPDDRAPILASVGLSVKNRCCQKLSGIHA